MIQEPGGVGPLAAVQLVFLVHELPEVLAGLAVVGVVPGLRRADHAVGCHVRGTSTSGVLGAVRGHADNLSGTRAARSADGARGVLAGAGAGWRSWTRFGPAHADCGLPRGSLGHATNRTRPRLRTQYTRAPRPPDPDAAPRGSWFGAPPHERATVARGVPTAPRCRRRMSLVAIWGITLHPSLNWGAAGGLETCERFEAVSGR